MLGAVDRFGVKNIFKNVGKPLDDDSRPVVVSRPNNKKEN
jgi:hypothetical protein